MLRLGDLLTGIAAQLYDTDYVDWTEAELVFWLRECLRAMAEIRSDLFTVFREIELSPGAEQAKPEDVTRLTRIFGVREDGDDRFRAVSVFDAGAMGAIEPNWMSAPPGPARQYAFGADRDVFWVYPPQMDPPGVAQAECVVLPEVPEPDSPGFADYLLPIDARYQRALVDYVLYRAYSKDADVAARDGRAAAHHQAFTAALGGA